jgi:uncharacterized protein (TIGR02284 family)
LFRRLAFPPSQQLKTMAENPQLADTLNELALFVNDRIEGYKTAAKETKDPQNQAYYQQLVQQSEQFVKEVNGYARAAGGKAEDSTTLKGKLYRTFMDAKAAVTGRSEASILDSNIYGEEWALKAYVEALASDDLTGTARQAVERQHQASQETLRKLQQLKGIASVG